ncbi:unnamed protein product [Acanthosepion pharaonis]|uniref:Uncharacterized protein n=1 Tax=Acanthosepion pharaonis TaxID=158019 RepID=A0A812E835_ACAPH|nr:unnamed protein product [Sepia pharaonis]
MSWNSFSLVWLPTAAVSRSASFMVLFGAPSQVFFTLMIVTVLFFTHGTKVMFSFNSISSICARSVPNRHLTSTSAATFVFIFLSPVLALHDCIRFCLINMRVVIFHSQPGCIFRADVSTIFQQRRSARKQISGQESLRRVPFVSISAGPLHSYLFLIGASSLQLYSTVHRFPSKSARKSWSSMTYFSQMLHYCFHCYSSLAARLKHRTECRSPRFYTRSVQLRNCIHAENKSPSATIRLIAITWIVSGVSHTTNQTIRFPFHRTVLPSIFGTVLVQLHLSTTFLVTSLFRRGFQHFAHSLLQLLVVVCSLVTYK